MPFMEHRGKNGGAGQVTDDYNTADEHGMQDE